MNLGILPDELVMIILANLGGPGDIRYSNPVKAEEWRQDYLSFALTCKRFLHLAIKYYNQLTEVPPWHYYSVLAYCTVGRDAPKLTGHHPGLSELGSCPVHGEVRDDPERCYYRQLYPVIASKHLVPQEIKFYYHDFRRANCLVSIESSRFDRITKLSFNHIDITLKIFNELLTKLTNVNNLYLGAHLRVRHPDDPDEPETTIERKLHCIQIEVPHPASDRIERPLLLPNVVLPARIVRVRGHAFLERGIISYMMRFSDEIELIVLDPTNIKVQGYHLRSAGDYLHLPMTWREVSQLFGLAHIKFKKIRAHRSNFKPCK